ncbi:MAG TPA: hypothetical protein VMF69_12175 [Gemmataceae bacterium]|nr:hypothetical protein [Gemmataceae bacterium]
MSTVNDEPLLDRPEGGRKLSEEADKLLRLAEGFQDKCEQYERSLSMLIAIGMSTITAFLIAALYVTPALPDDSVYRGLVPYLAIFYSIAAGAFLYWMTERTRRKLARERRAMHSIVDMLRGLEKGIAEMDNLSTLERAEFRIRISRFDIGPG